MWRYFGTPPHPTPGYDCFPINSQYSVLNITLYNQTPWSKSASELYRLDDAACRRSWCQLLWIDGATLSAWRIPSAVFLVSYTWAAPFSFKLYSGGWVDPVPDPLRLRKSGRAGNRTRTSGSVDTNTKALQKIRKISNLKFIRVIKKCWEWGFECHPRLAHSFNSRWLPYILAGEYHDKFACCPLGSL
jgi:hypothetical protein